MSILTEEPGQTIICDVCGEELEFKDNWAVEPY